MVGGPASRCRLNTFKTKFGEIEQINERVDHANAISLVDPIIKAFGQQRRLPASRSCNEALHDSPRQNLKTMRTLNIEVPANILALADEVIAQQLEPLWKQFGRENARTDQIARWPTEACDQTKPDWIAPCVP